MLLLRLAGGLDTWRDESTHAMTNIMLVKVDRWTDEWDCNDKQVNGKKHDLSGF